MVTDTQNRIEKNDHRTLWTIMILIVAGVLAYAAYISYYDTTLNSTAVTTTDGTLRNPQ